MVKACPDCEELHRLAIRAGRVILEKFGVARYWLKNDGTRMTDADISINDLIMDKLSVDYPDVGIMGEEGKRIVKGAECVVYFDPIDATWCYSRGIPLASFCIATVIKGIPTAAVIYDPFNKRIWRAIKGKGAFMNGKPIRVSERRKLAGSGLCILHWCNSEFKLAQVTLKAEEVGATCINPLSIAYFGGLVASGNMEATLFPGSSTWEAPAIQLIVEEAGGKFTDIRGMKICYDGNPISGHIASNGFLHEDLISLVASYQ